MNERGFAAIGLDRIKTKENLGGILRAAGAFDASLVVVAGGRLGKYATDTMRAYRHMPCIEVDSLSAHVPFGATVVAVELHERARDLSNFVHPESAFYVFGPEDGSVRAEYIDLARAIVRIPAGCLNVAAAVNVVLYDRAAKQARRA